MQMMLLILRCSADIIIYVVQASACGYRCYTHMYIRWSHQAALVWKKRARSELWAVLIHFLALTEPSSKTLQDPYRGGRLAGLSPMNRGNHLDSVCYINLMFACPTFADVLFPRVRSTPARLGIWSPGQLIRWLLYRYVFAHYRCIECLYIHIIE